MAKRTRKKYTAEQKYEYHKRRANDNSVTKAQQLYSKHWVNGFLDDHPEQNLSAGISEYNRNKKYMDREAKAVFKGEINGNRAAVKDKSAAHKIKYNY